MAINGIILSLMTALCLVSLPPSLLPQQALSVPLPGHHLKRSAHSHLGRWKRSSARDEYFPGRKTHRRRSLIASLNTTTSAAEVSALLAFKSSIRLDPTGALANWTMENNASVCSTWKGVTCNARGEVEALHVAELGLNGTIAPQMGDLVHLAYLNCSWNSLWGPIPDALLGGCQKLAVLDLNVNSLNGTLSPKLFTLPKLEQLHLANNSFSGPLPEVADNGCRSLKEFWIRFTSISGALPSSLRRCQNLTRLVLDFNQLNGSIPAWLGGLRELRLLGLGSNSFTGKIPSRLGSLKNLEGLGLWNNKLGGQIPPSLGKLSQLKVLWLDMNRLSGQIPPSLGKLSQLKFLRLEMNLLSGSIPNSLGMLQQLEDLEVSGNNLTGSIPRSLGNCSSLLRLGLYSNQLTGEIPSELGTFPNLTQLVLQQNALTGPFPTQLCNLSNLELLALYSNMLSFDATALSCLTRCAKLEILALNDNKIYGSLRELDLTKFPRMKILVVQNNQLTGEIPPSFGSTNCTLAFVDFRGNQFTGGFPAEVDGKNLSNLFFFASSHNQLEGAIPSWFGNLKTLQVLILSSNKLTGGIPPSFRNLERFKLQPLPLQNFHSEGIYIDTTPLYPNLDYGTTYMDLSSNALEGALPLELTELATLKYLNLSNNKFRGQIWPNIHNMKALELLDLSQNNLTGPLPPTLPPALSRFNVSLNDLSGAIPSGNQFGSFPESSYLPGNPGLCGMVIRRPCDTSSAEMFGISDNVSILGFGMGAASGFVMAVAAILAWAPARMFVLGVRQQEGPRKYGLFTSRF